MRSIAYSRSSCRLVGGCFRADSNGRVGPIRQCTTQKGGTGMKALTLLLAVVLCAGVSFAQGTSQIQGLVRDETGSAVPAAGIKATQTDTNTTRTTTTGSDGTYVLANLPIGPYRLEI